jgi:hypothetical protein
MKFLKYLKKEMSQKEIVDFEETLKKDKQLQQEFLRERAVFIAAREVGRKELRNRFTRLETERKKLGIAAQMTEFEKRQQWMAKAAFMHQLNIDASSLPVSDETLADFLKDEEN